MNEKDQKKQIPLRLTKTLWNDLSAWAADDFRSVNGQIEYLLTECVKQRKRDAHTNCELRGSPGSHESHGSHGLHGPPDAV